MAGPNPRIDAFGRPAGLAEKEAQLPPDVQEMLRKAREEKNAKMGVQGTVAQAQQLQQIAQHGGSPQEILANLQKMRQQGGHMPDLSPTKVPGGKM